MMTGLHSIPGRHYDHCRLPAHAAATATELVGMVSNPFQGNAKLASLHVKAPSAVTGDDTNRTNLNIQLQAGTEIAHLDLATGVNLAPATWVEVDLSAATDAQLEVAEGESLLIQAEKVGTGVAIPAGTIVRAGWISN